MMNNKKLNEMAEAHINSKYAIARGKITKLMMHVRKESYLAGFQAALSLPEVKELQLKSAHISAWLRRMSELKWNDPEYAPNFKKAHEELEKALADMGEMYRDWETDRKSTRLNSSHSAKSRMPSSA